jgi:hypothetical protein
MADGSCGSLTYYDTPVRGEHGWRITTGGFAVRDL